MGVSRSPVIRPPSGGPVLYRSAIAAACLSVAAAGTLVSTSLSAASPASPGSCPDQVTFAVGGTGDTHSQHVPGVPAGPRENIDYPASIRPIGVVTGNESISVGTDELDSRARSYRSRCPDTHINAQGYSLGAVVVSTVCDRWQIDSVMSGNTTCTTVGNPIRPQRDGTSGILGQLPPIVPGLAVDRHDNRGPIPVTDVCNSNDIICNAPNPVVNPLEFANGILGYYEGDHGYAQPIPNDPGDYVYYQQPRIDGARPTTPALQSLPTVPVVLDAVEHGRWPAPSDTFTATLIDAAFHVAAELAATTLVDRTLD
ncbi:hypothetical protein BH683_025025 [Williamsia sp. 1138]|nr:hypothetical protein BH683_025025 [Williamsia sp. 1138]